MKILPIILAIMASVTVASAWQTSGRVYCDANGNGQIDPGDIPLAGVWVEVDNLAGTFHGANPTDASGRYVISLPEVEDTYVETLVAASLPSGAVIVIPAAGKYQYTINQANQEVSNDWLISSPECAPPPPGACWLTAGGVKFEALVGLHLAEKGPDHSFGGNVFPSCDPDPGNGGQWNHIAHAYKLHFQGWDIHTVECGNVPGIEPGSESPVTPFNFIEFQGTGTLKGIKGNKVDHGTVFFFARAEDRNEPGNEHGAKAGADIDRYFLHVFDADGNTLLLVDSDGNPATIDPITITGGNLQLHISSCD